MPKHIITFHLFSGKSFLRSGESLYEEEDEEDVEDEEITS
jgi:hypothetical protein